MSKAKKRRWLRWLRYFGIAFLLLLLTATAAAYIWLRGSLPDYDGSAPIAGLTAQVTVSRDADGIPSIFAANIEDAYRALGFIHAQDRFFQMEMTRRVGAGRLSEALGESTLAIDRLMRTLDLDRKSVV